MQRGKVSRKCRCRRYNATWLCTFPNCAEHLFCKKCRKNHNRRHEENFYPVRELLDDEAEEPLDDFEFSAEESEQLFRKIDDEIERLQDDFDEQMKDARRSQRRRIADFRLGGQSRAGQTSLTELRRKVLQNPRDEEALKRLGREYHKFLQESNVQGADRRKLTQKFRDDLERRFEDFARDLRAICAQLRGAEASAGRRGSRQKEGLVESEVRNSTIPKEWDKEDPMEEVNKSLHLIRQHKQRSELARDE